MPSTIRLFFDATVAVAFMVVFASIAASVAAAVTDDRTIIIATGASVFVLTGLMLLVRLWRTTHGLGTKTEPGT